MSKTVKCKLCGKQHIAKQDEKGNIFVTCNEVDFLIEDIITEKPW